MLIRLFKLLEDEKARPPPYKRFKLFVYIIERDIMEELTNEELSEMYYLANRQFNYYVRKLNRYVRTSSENNKVSVDSKYVYLYERVLVFDKICKKLLKMNPDILVKIDEFVED